MKLTVQSLHSHTLLSDGKLTHFELLDKALKYGVSVIAFTDHDSLPDQQILKELKDLDHQTKWLIGIELSVSLPGQKSGNTDSGLHILGLFVDPTDKSLLTHCQNAQQERVRRMKKVVEGFNNLGFEITSQQCLKIAKGSSVGLPHIVEALKSHDQNLKLIKQYKNKMEDLAKNDPKVKKQYELMIAQGENQYPYALFLNQSAPFNVKAPYKYSILLSDGVNLIKKAGGVTSLAHYTTSKNSLPPYQLANLFKENLLDGAETVYRLFGASPKLEEMVEKDRKLVRDLVKKYQKIATGGADAHREEDFYEFTKDKNFCNQTLGMVENIIEKAKVSLEWTNFTKS